MNIEKCVIGFAPTVIENQNLVNYSGIFFNESISQSTSQFIAGLQKRGFINEHGPHVLDGLTKNGDIVQDFPLTEDGLQYLVNKMNVIRSDNPAYSMLNEVHEHLNSRGFDDLFILNGQIWGYQNNGVMPVPCGQSATFMVQ